MKSKIIILVAALSIVTSIPARAANYAMTPTPQDMQWLLPNTPPAPVDNAPTAARVELGKKLFFDPRLSADRNMSCATCHSPLFGWSDGQPTARGAKSKVLGRASPTVFNTAYNTIQMWDGRKATLEDQAMGPMESADEMAMDVATLFAWLSSDPTYKAAFEKAYPGEAINHKSLSKAIASFERSLVSNNSQFDKWLRGAKNAMTPQQVRGFRLFTDPAKGNCAACHQPPNFTDNGFHNIGVGSPDATSPDVGRYAIKRVKSMKGAFKTPTLRDIALTAPYFRDGSAGTLMDVIEHYNRGGTPSADVSPDIKPLNLARDEMEAIVEFQRALTTTPKNFTLPVLPN
jgi:cytochrome c peroxidase